MERSARRIEPGTVWREDCFGIGILVATSVERMLSSFAEDLDAGKYFLQPEALEDGEQFLNCKPDIDLLNWPLSPRWAHLRDGERR